MMTGLASPAPHGPGASTHRTTRQHHPRRRVPSRAVVHVGRGPAELGSATHPVGGQFDVVVRPAIVCGDTSPSTSYGRPRQMIAPPGAQDVDDSGVACGTAGCCEHAQGHAGHGLGDPVSSCRRRADRKERLQGRISLGPKREAQKVVPWSSDRVAAVTGRLPERYQIAVVLGVDLGLRQGEILESRLVFGPPKANKTRTIPLPSSVREHWPRT